MGPEVGRVAARVQTSTAARRGDTAPLPRPRGRETTLIPPHVTVPSGTPPTGLHGVDTVEPLAAPAGGSGHTGNASDGCWTTGRSYTSDRNTDTSTPRRTYKGGRQTPASYKSSSTFQTRRRRWSGTAAGSSSYSGGSVGPVRRSGGSWSWHSRSSSARGFYLDLGLFSSSSLLGNANRVASASGNATPQAGPSFFPPVLYGTLTIRAGATAFIDVALSPPVCPGGDTPGVEGVVVVPSHRHTLGQASQVGDVVVRATVDSAALDVRREVILVEVILHPTPLGRLRFRF